MAGIVPPRSIDLQRFLLIEVRLLGALWLRFERNVGLVEGRSVNFVLFSGLASVGPTMR